MTCRYWQSEQGEKVRKGNCRRFAPRPDVSLNEASTARWPVTHMQDWCGEYVEAKVAKA
jgi:hypothetical protein